MPARKLLLLQARGGGEGRRRALHRVFFAGLGLGLRIWRRQRRCLLQLRGAGVHRGVRRELRGARELNTLGVGKGAVVGIDVLSLSRSIRCATEDPDLPESQRKSYDHNDSFDKEDSYLIKVHPFKTWKNDFLAGFFERVKQSSF